MSDGVAVTIRNKDRLFAKLRRLRPRTTQELARSIAQSAEEVARLARQLAPRDSGDLIASIVAEVNPDAVGPSARVTAGNGKAYYARWVEFGTAPHPQGGSRPGTMHPGNRPQPFLFPAYRLLKRRTKGRIARALGKAARAVAG